MRPSKRDCEGEGRGGWGLGRGDRGGGRRGRAATQAISKRFVVWTDDFNRDLCFYIFVMLWH